MRRAAHFAGQTRLAYKLWQEENPKDKLLARLLPDAPHIVWNAYRYGSELAKEGATIEEKVLLFLRFGE